MLDQLLAMRLLDHFRSILLPSLQLLLAAPTPPHTPVRCTAGGRGSLGMARPEAAGVKLQIWFGFGELVVMAWGGGWGGVTSAMLSRGGCRAHWGYWVWQLQEGKNRLGLSEGKHGGTCPGPSCWCQGKGRGLSLSHSVSTSLVLMCGSAWAQHIWQAVLCSSSPCSWGDEEASHGWAVARGGFPDPLEVLLSLGKQELGTALGVQHRGVQTCLVPTARSSSGGWWRKLGCSSGFALPSLESFRPLGSC